MHLLKSIVELYPYFFACLFGGLIFLAIYLVAGDQKRMMIISGLMMIPLAPLAVLNNGDYWSPERLGGGALGVEDFLFSFLCGGAAWFEAVWLFRNRVTAAIESLLFIARYAWLMAVGVSTCLLGMFMGFDSLSSVLLCYSILIFILLVLRFSLWPMAVVAGLQGLIYYWVFMKIVFWIWPDFLMQWSSKNIWYENLLGVPAGELAWAATYTAVWPLIIAYASDTHLESPFSKT
jgi:hypothetical protein